MDARYAGYSLCIRTTSLLKCAHIQWLGRFVLFSYFQQVLFFVFFFSLLLQLHCRRLHTPTVIPGSAAFVA